jgi:mRNA-degrading endonuclease RelE of RelBE toxin-antitoxin system
MTWRIEWLNDAVESLTQCYLDADDKHEVTDHAAILERLLKHDPVQASVPLVEDLRAADSGPLRLYIEIVTGDRSVRILAVTARKRRR